MKRIKNIILSTAIVAGFILPAFTSVSEVRAVDVFSQACNSSQSGSGGGNQNGGSSQGGGVCGAKSDKLPDLTKSIINTLFILLGIVAVIMIVIGGIRYTTSNGDANQTKSAKDTILYAVVGLIVAIMAYAIVGFVLQQFTK